MAADRRFPAYNASKAGALNPDPKHRAGAPALGVRVNAVAPGAIEIPLSEPARTSQNH